MMVWKRRFACTFIVLLALMLLYPAPVGAQLGASFGEYFWSNEFLKVGAGSVLNCLSCSGPTSLQYTLYVGAESRKNTSEESYSFAYAGKVRFVDSTDWFSYYYARLPSGQLHFEILALVPADALSYYRVAREIGIDYVTITIDGLPYISLNWFDTPVFRRVVAGGRILPPETTPSSYNVSFNTDQIEFADVDFPSEWGPMCVCNWRGNLNHNGYGYNRGVSWRCSTDTTCPHTNS